MNTTCPGGERWRAAMRLPFGEYGARVRDSAEEQAFWHRYIQNRRTHVPDAYSVKVADAVCGLLQTQGSSVQSILELGPGWGNYTFRLAEQCSRLVCADISQDNLRYLQQQASAKGVCNIQTLCGEWETILPPRCDVVFAYNCFYRMHNIEDCLLKIHRSARTLCIIGMNESPEQPFLPELEQLGLPVRYTRQDYRQLRQILHELGIHAQLLELPNKRVYSYPDKQALLAAAAGFIQGNFDKDAVFRVLERHYTQDNGQYTCQHTFRSGLLFWTHNDRSRLSKEKQL